MYQSPLQVAHHEGIYGITHAARLGRKGLQVCAYLYHREDDCNCQTMNFWQACQRNFNSLLQPGVDPIINKFQVSQPMLGIY